MIYLDNAATTYPKPECVYVAMDHANRNLAFNAGRGLYQAAQDAVSVIDETRGRLSALFHADGIADIVFAPSVTHALNQIINGISTFSDSVFYLSPYEHNAVARTVHAVATKTGAKVKFLPVNDDLSIDVDKTRFLFRAEAPSVVVMTAVSNVTGYALPAEEILSEAKKNGAVTILDAAQAAGLLPIDMRDNNADFVCFAGHKTLMGPFGVAGFAIRHGVKLSKVLTGGTGSNSLNLEMPSDSPARFEASSQNVVAVAGLNAALGCLDVDAHHKKVQNLTDYLLTRLSDVYGVHVLGSNGHNIGIVSFVVDGYSSGDVGTILNEEHDIAVRTGYHCAPYIHDFLLDKEYGGTVRIGLGIFNTFEDVDALIDALNGL